MTSNSSAIETGGNKAYKVQVMYRHTTIGAWKKISKEIMEIDKITDNELVRSRLQSAPLRPQTQTQRKERPYLQSTHPNTIKCFVWKMFSFFLFFNLKIWKTVSEDCLSFSGVLSGDWYNCLTDLLKNCSLKNKCVFVRFLRQKQGREQLLIPPYLSCHARTKLVWPCNSFCLLNFWFFVRIPGYFYGCNRDWVQLTYNYNKEDCFCVT